MTSPRRRRPLVLFLIICLLAVVAGTGYIIWSRATRPRVSTPTEEAWPTGQALEADAGHTHLLFRNTSLGEHQGRVTIARLDNPSGRRFVTGLTCERVHFAAGHGVCLVAERGFQTSYRAFVFDARFAAGAAFPLPGIPSRVRLSPDGRRAGMTVFVNGDSYTTGSFSTRTFLIDTATGENLGDLEQYTVTRNNERFSAVDFNFWGVTFADARHFFATLGTGGRTYLVSADAGTKTAQVIYENVECPSLSPDHTRVAFKDRRIVEGRLVFRLQVLDLANGQRTTLAESRSVDDQPEWLDDNTVSYGLPSASLPGSTGIWAVPADGTGMPRLVIEGGWSPAVVP
jgi:hypothetical protein